MAGGRGGDPSLFLRIGGRLLKRPNSRRAEPRLRSCEPRIALSASAVVDWWNEIDVAESSSAEPSSAAATEPPAGDAPDLFAQAKNIRDTTGLTGAGQTAVIIDTGIAADHITLGGENRFGPGYRVVGGWDFAENDAVPYDDGPAGFHGTHVASALGGLGGGFEGIATGADLVSLRVFDDLGQSDPEWVRSALQWVHDHQDEFESPITTVNLSIGGLNLPQGETSPFETELRQLREDGILVFAAAGNSFDGDAELAHPASSEHVVAVGAVEPDSTLAEYSNRDAGVLTTIGSGINGAVPDHVYGWDGKVDDFAEIDGTSMATPQVAGASMLIRQALQTSGQAAEAEDVLSVLESSVVRHRDSTTGVDYGVIDLDAALQIVASRVQPDVASPDEMPLPAAEEVATYTGSTESESLTLTLGSPDDFAPRVAEANSAGDVSTSYRPTLVDGVWNLDGGGGNDRLVIHGTEASERVILRGGHGAVSELVLGEHRIQIEGFEEIHFGGSDGDRVTLFDSAGDDTLRSSIGSASLEGRGYRLSAEGVREVYAHGTAGGRDVAYLSDTAGDETLVVRPNFTSLRSGGNDLGSPGGFQLAFGFEEVHAYSRQGGDDSALIYDSVGDDTLHLSSGRSFLVGPGYQVTANGFGDTDAISSGGQDSVRIYLDDFDDLRHGDVSSGWDRGEIGIETEDGRRSAKGFDRFDLSKDYRVVDWSEIAAEDRRQHRRLFEAFGMDEEV